MPGERRTSNARKGIFITLEGVEGSGKSTQVKLLHEYLEKRGYEVLPIREPGGTPIGDRIRSILLDPAFADMDCNAELLLYMASRAQLVTDVIAPALAAGKIVICDRFTDSCLAYQGFGRGLPMDTIRTLNDWVTKGLSPDLTFVLWLPIQEGLCRATKSSADRIEQEDINFHAKVENGYKVLARENPDRVRIVDAKESPEKIHQVLVGFVEGLLERGTTE